VIEKQRKAKKEVSCYSLCLRW